MKAGIYLRISKDFTGEGLGVSRQLEDCTGLANQLGWDIAEVYTDNDVSATSGKTRPQYRKMLTDIDAGHIQGIIAWHADRLYRKATDLGELVDICKRNNTQIATVRAGAVDLTTPTGRLVAGLLAQVATYEGEAKADRWQRSWRQGREAGHVARTGSRMYGYTRDGELIEEEAAIARRMVDHILTGGGMGALCRQLQAEGIRTTRDSAWRPATIRQYLANPRITSYSTLKGEIVAEGNWEPILDRETWETIRALLAARTRPYVPRVGLLNGLAFCSLCGTRLIAGHNRGKRAYRCDSRPGIEGCGKIFIYADTVNDYAENVAQLALQDPAVRTRIAELRAEPNEVQHELAELEMRRKELEDQLDQPGTPVQTILRAIDRTRERQEKLLSSLAAVPRVPIPGAGDPWPEDLKRRRALIDLVIERIEVTPRIIGSPPVARVQITPRATS